MFRRQLPLFVTRRKRVVMTLAILLFSCLWTAWKRTLSSKSFVKFSIESETREGKEIWQKRKLQAKKKHHILGVYPSFLSFRCFSSWFLSSCYIYNTWYFYKKTATTKKRNRKKQEENDRHALQTSCCFFLDAETASLFISFPWTVTLFFYTVVFHSWYNRNVYSFMEGISLSRRISHAHSVFKY